MKLDLKTEMSGVIVNGITVSYKWLTPKRYDSVDPFNDFTADPYKLLQIKIAGGQGAPLFH